MKSPRHILLLLFIIMAATAFAQPDRVYRSVAEIKNPADVYALNLSWKRLKSVPSVVFECENLRVLDLSHNRIDSLPPTIGQLHNLEELRLQRNRLRNLPPQLGSLAALKTLNLSRNPLLELPGELASLSSLEELIVWMTGIVELPPSFVVLNSTLKVLDMRACPMTYDNQEEIDNLLPAVRKKWDYVCNCK